MRTKEGLSLPSTRINTKLHPYLVKGQIVSSAGLDAVQLVMNEVIGTSTESQPEGYLIFQKQNRNGPQTYKRYDPDIRFNHRSVYQYE